MGRPTTGQRTDAGASRATWSDPSALPVQLTRFIGRERQVDAVRGLLNTDRLVTLTGPGGVGKTRLALEVARVALDEFTDGVRWVDLGPVTDAALVPDAVRAALGVGEAAGGVIADRLTRLLAKRHMLLLFDNCEHVIDACAVLCDRLLRSCPGLVILATSREPLGLEGERIWRVPSLTVPGGDDPDDDSEAVRLFADRARYARPTFALNDASAGPVLQIVRRLDGLPLAIELAAARVRVLSVEQIAAGLDDRFRLLTGGMRPTVPRQRTLEASIDWSHDLLDDRQRRLLRRLAVFAGSFALDSAEAVCSGDGLDPHEVFDLLAGLVDRSLVQREDETATSRYRLLETIRQYASNKLVEAGEADGVRSRHLAHYTDLVERLVPSIESGGTVEGLRRLRGELDNIRAAIDWAATAGMGEDALRLATLWPECWSRLGYVNEGRNRIAGLIGLAEADTSLFAEANVALVWLGARQGSGLEAAMEHGSRGLEMAREVGDRRLEARALLALTWISAHREPDRDHSSQVEVALAAAREAGDSWAERHGRLNLADGFVMGGDYGGAQSVAAPVVEEARAAGDLLNLCLGLTLLGHCSTLRGRPVDGEEELREALTIAKAVGDHYLRSWILVILGQAVMYRGDYAGARPLVEDQLRLAAISGNAYFGGWGAFVLSALSLRVDEPDAALTAALEGISILQGAGIRHYLSLGYSFAARAALQLGDIPRATTLIDEARATAVTPLESGLVWLSLAALALMRGDVAQAEDLSRDALQQIGADSIMTADSLEFLGWVLTQRDRHADAVHFLGAAHALREDAGLVRWPSAESIHEHVLATTRETLGDQAFSIAWEKGAALSAEEAVGYATRGRGPRRRPPAGWESLTPVELDVVRLVAAGLTNPQIAEKIFVSPRTVQSHLRRIFQRLGVTTRAELAAQTARRDLTSPEPR